MIVADYLRTPEGRERITVLNTDAPVALVLEPNAAGEFDVLGAFNRETGERATIPACFRPSTDALVAAGEALEAGRRG